MYMIRRTSRGSLKNGEAESCDSATAAVPPGQKIVLPLLLLLLRSRWSSNSRVKVLGLIFGRGGGSSAWIRSRAASRVDLEEGFGAGGLERRSIWERRKKGRRRRKRRASRLSFMVDSWSYCIGDRGEGWGVVAWWIGSRSRWLMRGGKRWITPVMERSQLVERCMRLLCRTLC